uniref:Cysteine rich secretory protein LCCL domain containing 2 n=1 Tax=Nothobranchius furzeri TaxID=105023 RepID=A0A8C6VTV5_NOTFU
MTRSAVAWPLTPSLLLLLCVIHTSSLFLPDSKELRELLIRYEQEAGLNPAGNRTRRAILWSDRDEILQLHNKLRGSVYPTASNMEHMIWDDELERSATQWAEVCQWDHGPQDLLMSIGQNLAGHPVGDAPGVWGGWLSVKGHSVPLPEEREFGPHSRVIFVSFASFLQLVWATTNRVGCAVHTCPQMNVWGEIWENAVYLVCNYSPKGNWIGEAPYQHGRPCSQCPPSYGGGCRNNLCYKGETAYLNIRTFSL